MTKEKSESASYNQMLKKVEKLVAEIDSPDVDLDSMVQKLEHGYELINAMRERLDQTKDKVEKLRTRYETEQD